MNVLLTSAGRRTSLLQAFRSCVHEGGGRVWAGDADPLAPALQVADEQVVLPPIDTDEYLPTLLDLVRTEEISLLVPLIDPELTVLAAERETFAKEDCTVLVSSSELLDLTLDTWKTVQHFSERGVRTPDSWLPDRSLSKEWPETLFMKPRQGSASKNARRVSSDELPHVLEAIEAPLLQEAIEAPEVTVDALFDLNGTLLHYVPRLRIRTLAGESIQGRTLPDDKLKSWLRPILREIGTLGARGPITLQAFLTRPEPTLSEVNARFGGGFPLARAAGGLYPAWIMQMCSGESVVPRLGEYTAGLCMTRAYTEWFVQDVSLPEERTS